jgi:hypothetical protein
MHKSDVYEIVNNMTNYTAYGVLRLFSGYLKEKYEAVQ